MKLEILQVNSKLKFAPLAWAIKFIQKTNYSHYAMRYTSSWSGRTMYVDATNNGVRITSENTFRRHYSDYKCFPMEVDETIFFIWIEELLGSRYSMGQIFYLWLKILKVKNGRSRFICNELVLDMLNYCKGRNITKLDTRDLNFTELEILKTQ